LTKNEKYEKMKILAKNKKIGKKNEIFGNKKKLKFLQKN